MQTSARQNYPADVPHEINPEQYRSLTHMFDEAFGRYAERPVSVCMERWMSYRQLDAPCRRSLGAWLQSLGLSNQVRVWPSCCPTSPVHGGDGRGAARGLHVREREPAVHGARTAASAARLGRDRDRHPRELLPHAAAGDRRHPGAACGGHRLSAICWAVFMASG
jgi:hypothetical protein